MLFNDTFSHTTNNKRQIWCVNKYKKFTLFSCIMNVMIYHLGSGGGGLIESEDLKLNFQWAGGGGGGAVYRAFIVFISSILTYKIATKAISPQTLPIRSYCCPRSGKTHPRHFNFYYLFFFGNMHGPTLARKDTA